MRDFPICVPGLRDFLTFVRYSGILKIPSVLRYFCLLLPGIRYFPFFSTVFRDLTTFRSLMFQFLLQNTALQVSWDTCATCRERRWRQNKPSFSRNQTYLPLLQKEMISAEKERYHDIWHPSDILLRTMQCIALVNQSKIINPPPWQIYQVTKFPGLSSQT